MNGQTYLDLIKKQMIFIHFKNNSLIGYTSLGDRKPFIKELQNFLKKKTLNSKIREDAFLAYLAMPTSLALGLNFSH